MITLVDYGLGNIQAFANIYKYLGIEFIVAKTPADIYRSSRLILPGVGSFDWAITKLQESGLREALDEQVLVAKIPVLGICVGMQIMARSSEEGILPGLGWINAKVKKLKHKLNYDLLPLPHMGWNEVVNLRDDPLFFDIEAPIYYFLHSYCIKTENDENVIATTNYGNIFTSAIRSENIYGTQFHPEKSHGWGVQLLNNFANF